MHKTNQNRRNYKNKQKRIIYNIQKMNKYQRTLNDIVAHANSSK